jgi:hypothetical protein
LAMRDPPAQLREAEAPDQKAFDHDFVIEAF